MNVTNYIFQSPYSSPIQVGRPDPSSKQEDSGSTSTKSESPVTSKNFGEILQGDTQSAQQVKPTVETNSLDTYA